MRNLALAAFLLLAFTALAQEAPTRSNPGKPCGSRSKGLPDFYSDAVLAQVKPPNWQDALIAITVHVGEWNLVLWTDGEQFKLWTDMPVSPQKGVYAVLEDLDEHCQLPPDPRDALELINLKWESTDLSAAEFAHLHKAFVGAMAQFVSEMPRRYSSAMSTPHVGRMYLDALNYPISYKTDEQEIEVLQSFEVAPMMDWVHEVLKLAEKSFHRDFGSKKIERAKERGQPPQPKK